MNVEGAVRITLGDHVGIEPDALRARLDAARRPPRRTSRASGSRKSMPISESTRSEPRWIDSSSSAERISVGR